MKAASILVAFAFAAAPALAQEHKMTLPNDLKWEAVPSLPKGAQIAVIEGPMNQAAPFTVRLKFPANYRIPPHHHPAIERVTVLQGTFNMGIGEKFDQKAGHALPVGGVMIMQPKTPHFAWTGKDEVVVQLHGMGPWGVTYVNPADDPRKQQ
jgi:quercetin dioxygenase-like cupin family protein